jgi:hypothetical protein
MPQGPAWRSVSVNEHACQRLHCVHAACMPGRWLLRHDEALLPSDKRGAQSLLRLACSDARQLGWHFETVSQGMCDPGSMTHGSTHSADARVQRSARLVPIFSMYVLTLSSGNVTKPLLLCVHACAPQLLPPALNRQQLKQARKTKAGGVGGGKQSLEVTPVLHRDY